MRREAAVMYRQALETTQNCMATLDQLQNSLTNKSNSKEDRADTLVAIYEVEKLLDSCRKRLGEAKKLGLQQLVAEGLSAATKGDASGLSVKTPFVTLTLSADTAIGVPRRSTDDAAHVALCRYLGIPLKSMECFDWHYDGLSKRISSDLEMGVPIPQEINLSNSYMIPKGTFRCKGKKSILDVLKEQPA